MSTRDAGNGADAALDSLLAIPRAVVEGGLDVQREVADQLLDRLEAVDDRRRRARLSSHYTAVQAVDRVEDVHPDEDASLDALYDGVGRTFDIAQSLDERTHEFATDTVENTAVLSERVVESCLEATEVRSGGGD